MSQMSRIDVDLGAVEHNVRALRGISGEGPAARAVCAVVKKDAYGLGAVQVAHRLIRSGVEMLAVYSPDEAAELVAKAVTLPILLLSPLRELNRTDVLYRHTVAEKLHVSIHDPAQLQAVNAIGHTFGIRMPIQPYIDTGMSRSGLSAEQFAAMMRQLHKTPFVRITGVYTHMATGDDDPDFLAEQFARFEAALQQVADALPKDAQRHAANTFTCFRDRRYHLDMIRPGLGLYGYGPEWLSPGPVIADAPTLRPAARWMTRVNHVQRYPKGTPVGYGSTHKLKRASVVGVVPVGYADGYPVALSNKGTVRVQAPQADDWIEANVLGRVNMDQLTIDLTDAAEGMDDINTLMNAAAEVYSNDSSAPNDISTLAKAAKTNPYELLCRLSPTIPRRYAN